MLIASTVCRSRSDTLYFSLLQLCASEQLKKFCAALVAALRLWGTWPGLREAFKAVSDQLYPSAPHCSQGLRRFSHLFRQKFQIMHALGAPAL